MMPNIFETLEQTEWWFGADGYPYRLTEMEQSHRINVLAFLRRRAQNLYSRHQWHEFRIMENAPEEVFNEWMREIESDPVEWLNKMPLMQELERLVKEHDTIDGEVISNGVVHDVWRDPVPADGSFVGSPTGRLRRDTPPRLRNIRPQLRSGTHREPD